MTNTEQLSIFDQPLPFPQTIVCNQPENEVADSSFALGDRIQIVNAGPPLQHLNGQKGKVIGLTPDVVSVQVEGIAVAMMFCPEALVKWTSISEYTISSDEAESVFLFRVGDHVECDSAFLGQVGTVRKLGVHCATAVAWVDYGEGKPLYPSPLEHLSRAE